MTRNEPFVGRYGLPPWTIEGRDEVEVAYMIARPRCRQGFGGEAARGLVRHGFEQLGLDRLIALSDPGNGASMRTAASAGLAFGRRFTMDGYDTVIHSIERTPARRESARGTPAP